jgi:two-component system alkaline phosphatase synthesis response regulator PhoP
LKLQGKKAPVGGKRFSTSVKVAVVDDDPELLRSVEVMLTVAGAKVLGATNGISGFLMIRREHPDVVLLDIMMPDMDGYEVCRKLKLDPLTKGIPIIFLTAKSGHSHIELGLSLGAQDYITKPFEDGELIGKITKMVNSPKPPASPSRSQSQD